MSALYWMRNDLRIHDNECLHRAMSTDAPLMIVYIFDPRQFEFTKLGFRKTGYLRFKFLCESLRDLRKQLKTKGANLMICIGQPEDVILELCKKLNFQHLFYQKEIASEEVFVEREIEKNLSDQNCTIQSVWGKTLYHIDDAPFSPAETPKTSKAFRLNLTKKAAVRPIFETPDKFENLVKFRAWGAIPKPEDLGFAKKEIQKNSNLELKGGETKALERLHHYSFGSELLTSYRWTRNRSLGMDYSSKFSPWMALGCLSPRQVYWEVKRYEQKVKKNISTWWLIFEIVWRDYFKYTAMRVGNKMFAEGGIKDRTTNWKYDQDLFDKWRFGKTGIPFIDAHMRELNATGFMSNRGRVNCASFLTRDYQIDWRWGAAWFETQLLDYDVCSNWLNWNTQATEIWYTNPVHQGLKYDKKGEYVKTWLPELANIETAKVQAPWLLTAQEIKKYGVKDYAAPVEIYKKWTRSINNIEKAHQKDLAEH